MKLLKKYYYLFLIGVLLPNDLLADAGQINVNFQEANPINAGDIFALVRAILDFVVKIGAALVVFFIIYAGFQFVTAQGDEGKVTSAKKTFMWTVIGGLVLLGAQALSGVVCNTAQQLGASVSCR